jgi:16S rRNA (cytosine967-C5)-methyltransferase
LPVSPARQAAYQILRRVDAGRGFAVDWLQGPLASALADADQRLATEMVMGVLRWRGALDFELERLSGKPFKYFDPEIVTILRLGIYQIGFLARVPRYAVVNEAVELAKQAGKRSATGLVNAVLRKCQAGLIKFDARGQSSLGTESSEYVRRAVPPWLWERWVQNFGPGATMALVRASLMPPPVTLRVTEAAGTAEEIRQNLAAETITARLGRLARRALVVESGNVLESSTLREGHVQIQDEASQLVGELVAPQPGQRVLDLCAAPGIKTRQLAEVLGAGTLVAADLSARRLRAAVKLLHRQAPSVGVYWVRLDATRELPFGVKFDRILVDAPCSGTGTLARNPEIKWRLQPKDIPRLAQMQAEILRRGLEVLAVGGRLVYSTCSFEPEENEQVVESVLEQMPGCRLASREQLCGEFARLSSLFDARGYFRTRPDLHAMDGFFAVVINRVRQG